MGEAVAAVLSVRSGVCEGARAAVMTGVTEVMARKSSLNIVRVVTVRGRVYVYIGECVDVCGWMAGSVWMCGWRAQDVKKLRHFDPGGPISLTLCHIFFSLNHKNGLCQKHAAAARLEGR